MKAVVAFLLLVPIEMLFGNSAEELMDSSDSWIDTWCRFPPTASVYAFCEGAAHSPANQLGTCSDGDCDLRRLKILHLTMHSGAKWELMGIAKALGVQVPKKILLQMRHKALTKCKGDHLMTVVHIFDSIASSWLVAYFL